MSRVSGAQLAELTGFAWRTVRRRLDDAGIQPVEKKGNADLYESRAALPILFAAVSSQGDDLDLQTERARLAKWQADKTEQDVELRAKRMVDAETVAAWVADMISTTKARMVQIPDAVAQHVDSEHVAVVAEQVRRLIYEALEDLASHGRGGPDRTVVRVGTAADVDGLGMG